MKLTFIGDVMCKKRMLDVYRDENGKYDFSEIFKEME